MRRKLIAGNWKMHGSVSQNRRLLDGITAGLAALNPQVDLAVFPPFVYLAQVQTSLADTRVAWGAQNVSDQAEGAFTGEISPSMLVNDFECRYVLIGHSERRQYFYEDHALLARKFLLAHEYGLSPILCVGETWEQREAGETEAVIEQQLAAIIEDPIGGLALRDSLIAYEPVWAIGTGKTAAPEEAQQVHQSIRKMVAAKHAEAAEKVRILYGGSVKPENAALLFGQLDIDGALVGGASLDAESFLAICRAAESTCSN